MIFENKYENGKKIGYFGAFERDKCIKFSLEIPRLYGITNVYMHLSADGINSRFYKKIPLNWSSISGSYDIYEAEINMSDIGVGLYYYEYELISNSKSDFYGKKALNGSLQRLENQHDGLIQLLIYEELGNHPNWIKGGVMYHIFVDRFAKSGKFKCKQNAIINEDWYNGIPQYPEYPGADVENNMFFGGDLYGIIEKLDYIKSLGVNCIYLSPIFEAYSNHKYDTADYMSIDSMFGDEETLEQLISEAKKRDIHIILDGVFNHTGADSLYFNKFGSYDTLGAYQSKSSPYYEWFNFKEFPNKYECWWDVQILPRVKSDTPSYKNFILGNGGVIEKWMKKGIAGFRLDVADELSDDFLKTLNSKLKSINPDGIIYGEVWEDASNKIAYDKRKRYFLGNELDSVMNYPLREAIIAYVKDGDFSLLCDTFSMLYTHYPKSASDLLMNVLGTHDTERILTVLGGESSNGYTNEELSTKKMTSRQRKLAINRLKMAYAINATVPGIPCIFYGDEVGMEGYHDPFNRLPFPWGKEDTNLLDFYQKIGKIRASEPLFKDGLFEVLHCDSSYLAFARYNEEASVVVVINRSNKKLDFNDGFAPKSLLSYRVVKSISENGICIFKTSESIENLHMIFDLIN
ncbi:MAG: glycoside hydrolase family 13 protein [Clostridia bacterium]|nr:glycoside hydrolase family 13 protein [Clostridia bacterium]